MGLNTKKVLGISVTTDSKKTILEYVQKYLKEASSVKRQASRKDEKPLVIVTPNPEQIVLAQKDSHFAEILNHADVAIPDGIGLVWALRKSNPTLAIYRIPGVEFMNDLVQLAVKKGYRVGLIGGWSGVAVKALECLSRRTSGLKGWAIEPEAKTMEEISEKIADTNTRLVFVGLGAPKQEYFIEKLKASVIAMAVGGSFDIIAGRTPRAPQAIQAIGLEWLWRLIREPWRWRRQMALTKFLWMVIWEKFSAV